jgi:hypothetical protein
MIGLGLAGLGCAGLLCWVWVLWGGALGTSVCRSVLEPGWLELTGYTVIGLGLAGLGCVARRQLDCSAGTCGLLQEPFHFNRGRVGIVVGVTRCSAASATAPLASAASVLVAVAMARIAMT